MSLLVPFGLKDGLLYGPLQVPFGGKCGCVCPACHHPLIARHNAKTPHFAHAANEDCKRGFETAVHLAAKQLIQERMQIALPEALVEYPGGYGKRPTSSVYGSSHVIQLSEVHLEVWQEGIRPDLIVTNAANRQQYLIEIAVTHFCDESKIEHIQQKGWYAVEIPLPKSDIVDFQLLERLLFKTPSEGKWLSHPKAAQLQIEYVEKNKQEWEARQKHEEQRFEKYRILPASEKITRNLNRLGMSRNELVKLTSFVAGEDSFEGSRLAWQSAVLAYIANVIEEDGYDGMPRGAYIEADLLNDWLGKTFTIAQIFKDSNKVAVWNYLKFLEERGILKRIRGASFEIVKAIVVS